tara:strand:+ start:440 stop:691 length:252 start_codon:yes stop_codon:yes gene_type:complete
MNQEKNYTLEQLSMWIEEALESEATPEEIYNCIRSTISSKITNHGIYLRHSKELLSLLSGNNALRFKKRRHTRLKVGKDMDIL